MRESCNEIHENSRRIMALQLHCIRSTHLRTSSCASVTYLTKNLEKGIYSHLFAKWRVDCRAYVGVGNEMDNEKGIKSNYAQA